MALAPHPSPLLYRDMVGATRTISVSPATSHAAGTPEQEGASNNAPYRPLVGCTRPIASLQKYQKTPSVLAVANGRSEMISLRHGQSATQSFGDLDPLLIETGSQFAIGIIFGGSTHT